MDEMDRFKMGYNLSGDGYHAFGILFHKADYQ